MAARRERFRESRRQADPAFPLQTPATRPAVRAPGQAAPAHQGHQGREVVHGQGALKEPKSRRKKSSKGLKVTFDLDSVQEYGNKDDDVIDCWEDICDFEGESGEGKLVINEEDIIDCDRELRDIGGNFLTITDDLNTGDQKVAASDSTNLNTDECFIGEGQQPPGTGSPGHPDDSKVVNLTPVNDRNSDSSGNVGGEDATFDGGLTAHVSGVEKIEVSNRSVSDGDIEGYEGGDNSSIIPFIDSVEEDPNEGNLSDDELETEPSGGSEETVIANWRKAGEQRPVEGESWQQVGAEDDTVADEPSLNDYYGDDSDNLITKEDIEAVFLALMEDQENEPLPSVGEVIEESVNSTLHSDGAVIPVSEVRYLPSTISGEREQSPEVSIGYECRDRKSASVYGSETESEGELVPCEDKCIGTADFLTEIGDAPLDLSVSKGTPSKGEETPDSRDECQGEHLSLASDKHQAGAGLEARTLDIPDAKLGDLSPSPEVEEDIKYIGKSESGKEEKINGKKAGKKKGKKNKREVKSEAVVKSPQIQERPKLVRGKGWREKRNKFKVHHGNPFKLSFGKELCESEVVEGTSNLLVETHTEASQVTPPGGCTDTTVTETPCSTSLVASEFSESEILDCVCGETREGGVAAVAQVTEVKTRDDVICHSPTVSQMPPLVAIEVAGANGEEWSDSSLSENDDFYIVKACTIAKPSEVLTEYVADSESSEDTSLSQIDSDNRSEDASDSSSSAENGDFLEPSWNNSSSSAQNEEFLEPSWNNSSSSEENEEFLEPSWNNSSRAENEEFLEPSWNNSSISAENEEFLEPSWNNSSSSAENEEFLEPSWNTYTVVEESRSNSNGDSSMSGVCDSRNSVYFDAQGSSCMDSLTEPFDYIQAFPGVVGTQKLNVVTSYDKSVSNIASQSGRRSNRPQTSVGGPSSRASGAIDVTAGKATGGADTSLPAKGEIVYEGPCSCGDRGNGRMGIVSEDEQLCVPPLLSDESGVVLSDDGRRMGVETHVGELHDSEMNSSLGSNPENLDGEYEENSKDIRSRINEIVGPRLQRERPRPTNLSVREEGAIGGPVDDHHGGREDSPLPGSSPASSSGVQGSDEMSLSRSRSRSPPREESSASPTLTTYNVPDLAYENYHVHELSPDKSEPDAAESLRALRLEGSVDSTPEKTKQVDYNFRTFREMYQINPTYLTDSDDHDDQNESDTVVPGSVSLSYDPERSITVSSWVSTSDDSPGLQEPGLSPPLPGTHATRKVPKVSRLLRETQGIVQRWEVVQAQAVERQRQRGQIRELQRQVKALRQTLEALTSRASELTQAEDIDTHRQLTDKLQEAKALQQEVLARKVEVSSVNLAVHRFHTETGYSLAPLKDDVADLFRVWDEAERRINSEVSRLEGVEATWKLWETQAEELTKALRQDGDTLKVLDAAIQTGPLTDTVTASVQGVARLLNDRRKTQPGKKLLLQHTKTQGVDIQGTTVSLSASGDECLSDSGTSGYESCSSEEFSERERRLAHLRKLARDLEASLHPNSQAWAAICKTLSSAETELKGLQKHCRELVVRSAETLDQAKTSPQLRRRSWAKDSKAGRTSRRGNNVGVSGRDSSGRGSGRRGWMWRVVRAALPFQAALLLLFCVACLLEPNCCDHVNTLNLSLSPQLRYVHGPPPV